ncbi:MAG: hypothetical protein KBD52_03560, partial [Candidatus Pacebacteria bacterium]|nr:hypothetical protein [Candidatus Paceibacterota bacterium]
MSLLEELVKKGIINKDQILEVKSLADEKFKGNIDAALLAMGITENQLLVAKGDFFNIPTRTIDVKKISFDILNYIPEDSAIYY